MLTACSDVLRVLSNTNGFELDADLLFFTFRTESGTKERLCIVEKAATAIRLVLSDNHMRHRKHSTFRVVLFIQKFCFFGRNLSVRARIFGDVYLEKASAIVAIVLMMVSIQSKKLWVYMRDARSTEYPLVNTTIR